MRGWLGRIRGAIGMGVTWAVGWAPIGAIVGAVLHMVLPGAPIGLGGVIALNATIFALLGFLGGGIFATVLSLTEGHHRFEELSLPRFAVWGAIGGFLLGGVAVASGLWGGGLGPLGAAMTGAATLLGAGSAAAALAAARTVGDKDRLTEGAAGRDAALDGGDPGYLLRKET